MRRVRIAGRCYQCRLLESKSYANQPRRKRMRRNRGSEKHDDLDVYENDFEEEEEDEEEASQPDSLRIAARAAVRIQQWFRRIEVARWMKIWNTDAKLIQSAWRRHKASERTTLLRAKAEKAKANEARIQELQDRITELEEKSDRQSDMLQSSNFRHIRSQAVWLFATTLSRRRDLTHSRVVHRLVVNFIRYKARKASLEAMAESRMSDSSSWQRPPPRKNA